MALEWDVATGNATRERRSAGLERWILRRGSGLDLLPLVVNSELAVRLGVRDQGEVSGAGPLAAAGTHPLPTQMVRAARFSVVLP